MEQETVPAVGRTVVEGICQECDEHISDVVHHYDNKPVCEACYDSTYFHCIHCDETQVQDGSREVYTGYRRRTENWCHICYENDAMSCDDCGDIIDCDSSVGGSGITVCQSCYDDHYFICQGCEELCHQDDGHYCEHCEETRCHDCSCGCDSNSVDNYARAWARVELIGDKDKAKHIKYDRLVGIELEAVDGEYQLLSDKLDRNIGISDDGSLSGDTTVEIQTPPASTNELERLVNNACNSLVNAEWAVNSSCGLHIHIDTKDIQHDEHKLRQLFVTYHAIEDMIFAMLPRNRRNNTYCKPLTNIADDKEFNKMLNKLYSTEKCMIQKKWYDNPEYDISMQHRDRYDHTRYHGLNMHSLLSNGHLEIRYHHGTTDSMEVINWIKFHLAIIDWATSSKFNDKTIRFLKNAPSKELKKAMMFHRMKLPDDVRRYVKDCINKYKNDKSPCDNDW